MGPSGRFVEDIADMNDCMNFVSDTVLGGFAEAPDWFDDLSVPRMPSPSNVSIADYQYLPDIIDRAQFLDFNSLGWFKTDLGVTAPFVHRTA